MTNRRRSQMTLPPLPLSPISPQQTVIRHRSLSVPGLDAPIAIAITTPIRRSSLFAETSKSPPLPPAYTAPSHSRNFSVPSTASSHTIRTSQSNPNLLTSNFSFNNNDNATTTNNRHSFTNARSNPSLPNETSMIPGAPPLTLPPSPPPAIPPRTFSLQDIHDENDRNATLTPPPPYVPPIANNSTHRARVFSIFSTASTTGGMDEESGPAVTIITGPPMTMDEYKSVRRRRKWYILACGVGVLIVLAVAISQLYGVWNKGN